MTQEAEGNFALGSGVRSYRPAWIPALGGHHKFHLNGGVRATGSNNEAPPGIFFRLLILRQQARQSFLPG